ELREQNAEALQVRTEISFPRFELRESDVHEGWHTLIVSLLGIQGRTRRMKSVRNLYTAIAVAAQIALFAAVASSQNSAPVAPADAEAWQITAQPQSSLVFGRDGSLIGEIGRQF